MASVTYERWAVRLADGRLLADCWEFPRLYFSESTAADMGRLPLRPDGSPGATPVRVRVTVEEILEEVKT